MFPKGARQPRGHRAVWEEMPNVGPGRRRDWQWFPTLCDRQSPKRVVESNASARQVRHAPQLDSLHRLPLLIEV